MSDRNLGYAVIIFLAAFIAVPAIYLTVHLLAPKHYRLVVFENINAMNFLKKDDRVRIHGAEAGQVRDVFLNNGKTYIRIKTIYPLDLHQGYSVSALAKGFMGDRYLEIDLGSSTAPRIAAEEILSGSFPPGPVELVAYSGQMKEKLCALIEITDKLRYSSTGKQSFNSRFKAIAKKLESVSQSLTYILRDIDRLAGKSAAVIQKSADFSTKLGSSVPKTVTSLDSIIQKTRKLFAVADSFVASSGPLIRRLNGQEAQRLDENFRSLKEKIESLKSLINDLNEQGLTVPVNL